MPGLASSNDGMGRLEGIESYIVLVFSKYSELINLRVVLKIFQNIYVKLSFYSAHKNEIYKQVEWCPLFALHCNKWITIFNNLGQDSYYIRDPS